MPVKPKVFIASSKEGERWARAVHANLEDKAEVTEWTDAFQIGQNTIDELLRKLRQSSFGIFVLSPDDTVTIRGKRADTARDNVIMELGMFIGRLGKERSFIVKPKNSKLRIPTDLLGVVTGEYDAGREDKDYQSACRPVCTQIADAMEKQTSSPSALDAAIGYSLQAICRAMSVPVTPEKASLRVFIFRKEGEQLVCRHYWDPNPSDEAVGITRLRISEVCAKRLVVVRCLRENAPKNEEVKTVRSPVRPLPKGSPCVQGEIRANLRYVLAAPIRDLDKNAWGVVNFDASNELGRKLLQKEAAKTVMVGLANYLGSVMTQ
ncbi:MAG: TIR domain-containing protein [Terriglobia bacterium]